MVSSFTGLTYHLKELPLALLFGKKNHECVNMANFLDQSNHKFKVG